MQDKFLIGVRRNYLCLTLAIFAVLLFSLTLPAFSEELKLQTLIDEALKNNTEIKAAQARISASEYRIPQAKSLSDPMLNIGYQSEGWAPNLSEQGSQPMIGIGQTIPFPGKRKLKGEIAKSEAESYKAELQDVKLKTLSRIKELYYDLFLANKSLEIVQDRVQLFSRIEDAALSRYSTGMGEQQDVLMAQTEKYNLLTQEEQLKQSIQSTEAMLNSTLGRNTSSSFGNPEEPAKTAFDNKLDDLIQVAYKNSPDLKAKENLLQGQVTKIKLAQKDYLPDVTVGGGIAFRGGGYKDMWNAQTQITIPVFSLKKRKDVIGEAKANQQESVYNLQSAKYELVSSIRDNYSVITSSDRLMRLYKDGLITKTNQDFELALTGYVTGKNDALTVISRLKSLIDYEESYWDQYIAREKAIARIEALVGTSGDNL